MKIHRGHMIGDTILTGWDVMLAEVMRRRAGREYLRGTPPVPHRRVESRDVYPTKYSPKQKVLLTLHLIWNAWPLILLIAFFLIVWRWL